MFEFSQKIIAVEWGQVTNATKTPLLKIAQTQLVEYLNQERKIFSIPLNPRGTHFQKSVWHEIQEIPCGKIKTYGEIATKLNTSARAVGGACGKNPIPIFIPCHRVMGTNGKLTGFSGGEGTLTKQALILLETPVKSTPQESEKQRGVK